MKRALQAHTCITTIQVLFDLYRDTCLTDERLDTACKESLQELQTACGETLGPDVLHARDRMCVLEHHKLQEKIILISEEHKEAVMFKLI